MAWANHLARIFLRKRPLLARGKILYFGTIMDTNRDSAHPSQNEDNFSTFPLGLEFLNEAEREKNNGKGDSLSKGETQQILTERLSGKAKQKTNWSVSTFKGKRKVFLLELVKFKTRAFNRKIVIKLIPILLNSLTSNNHFWYWCLFFASDLMHNFTGYVIKQLVHAFSCALSSYGALGKFGEHSRS